MTNIIFNEGCLSTISRMPNDYLDCVITSPPYWQLRDYGHSDQWGLESTFQEYLERLWQLMDELKPKLKSSGTVWINLGDMYNSNKKGNTSNKGYIENTTITTFEKHAAKQYADKTLLLIPHRFAIGCIDRGWTLRNDIIWAKPNGMPESVTDRFSKKHEFVFFFVKSEKYHFDLESVKDKTITKDTSKRNRDETKLNNTPGRTRMKGLVTNDYDTKNPGDVSDFWEIPTIPSSHTHFAAYNDRLIHKPIIAGCPPGGIIYDPFMGSGSTAIAAYRRNRNFIGSELSLEYFNLANKNITHEMAQQRLFND